MLRRTIRAEHHSLAINTHGNCWRCNTSVIRDDELITFLKRTIFLCESEAVGILLARMAILCEYEVCVLLLLHTRSAGASFGVTSRRDLKVVEQRALSLKSRTGNEFRCYLPELDLNTTRVKRLEMVTQETQTHLEGPLRNGVRKSILGPKEQLLDSFDQRLGARHDECLLDSRMVVGDLPDCVATYKVIRVSYWSFNVVL
jgi:hypothetical protein